MLVRMLGAAILMLAASTAGADDQGWRPEKSRKGVQMYTRAVKGWEIREIRGVEKIAAPLASVIAVLVDIEAGQSLSDVVSESKIVQRDSPTRYRFYSVMDLPWPVSDRDVVYQRQIRQDPQTLVVTLDDDALTDADAVPPRDGLVRMVKSHQTWTLTPEEDETRVELRVLADPNGPIPAAIINAMSVDTPMQTLIKLAELARSPRYADAEIAFIRQPPRTSPRPPDPSSE